MYLSKLFTKTTKESSGDAACANADLLTRAGFVHKTMAGTYSYLPLGIRVLRKVEEIVREEMDTIGNEVFMSALSPYENWEKTGRAESIDVLYSATAGNEATKAHHDAHYVLCGTHEELITPIVQHFVKSYQDLPCAAYQIQTKFRCEARPKSGLLRGREFRMKDLYSFHTTEEDMLRYFHDDATPAYERVFNRLGIGDITVKAWASGGDFSTQNSIEFQTRCSTGEDLIFHAPGTDEYFNREIAPSKAVPWDNGSTEMREREDVLGEGIIGVEALAEFLGIPVLSTTKTIIFETEDNEVVAVAVRGDYEVNELKLKDVLGGKKFALASAETVTRVTGAEVGYAGPIDLPDEVRVIWDDSCKDRLNFECGANKTNYHTVNANFGRDCPEPEAFYDIKLAKPGDLDPKSGKEYETFAASEVGNLYTLFTKYTSAFDFTHTAQDGSLQPVYMGCYGLGTTRVVGVLAEIFHDEHGLLWPEAVAPAAVHIVPIAKQIDDEAYQKAEELYNSLTEKGVECLFDDRLKGSVGAKLADADLIGVPTRIVVSPKTLEKGGVEVKRRSESEADIVSIEEVLSRF